MQCRLLKFSLDMTGTLFAFLQGFPFLLQDLAQVEELDSCSYSAEAGRDNPNKNRYRDILPCKQLAFFLVKHW